MGSETTYDTCGTGSRIKVSHGSKNCTSTLMKIPEITIRRPAELYKLIFFELVNNLITFGT